MRITERTGMGEATVSIALKVLGKTTSINVRKVLWTCAELGLPYDCEAWGSGIRSTDTPEFKALNPNAMVPVLLDGSFVLWESNTICRYLATAYGNGTLLPVDPRHRALVEQWMDWQATELNPAWRYAFMALVRKSADHADPVQVDAGLGGWNDKMRLLEDQLRTAGPYVTGATFTLADVVLGLSVNRWRLTPMDERPVLPAVAAYVETLASRAACRLHCDNGVP